MKRWQNVGGGNLLVINTVSEYLFRFEYTVEDEFLIE